MAPRTERSVLLISGLLLPSARMSLGQHEFGCLLVVQCLSNLGRKPSWHSRDDLMNRDQLIVRQFQVAILSGREPWPADMSYHAQLNLTDSSDLADFSEIDHVGPLNDNSCSRCTVVRSGVANGYFGGCWVLRLLEG